MDKVSYYDIASYDRRHQVEDEDKVENLVSSMLAEGWIGDPLVVDEQYGAMLAGVHRMAALDILEENYREEAFDLLQSIPVVFVELEEHDPFILMDDDDVEEALRDEGYDIAADIIERGI